MAVGYPTGINDLLPNSISVYPIPSADILYVDMKDVTGYAALEVMDMTGREILSQPVKSKIEQIDISGLDKGIYLLRIKATETSRQLQTKFIKE
jgi:hypothetical protein